MYISSFFFSKLKNLNILLVLLPLKNKHKGSGKISEYKTVLRDQSEVRVDTVTESYEFPIAVAQECA